MAAGLKFEGVLGFLGYLLYILMGSSRRRGRWSCGSMHALRNKLDGDEGKHPGGVFRLVAEVGVAMVVVGRRRMRHGRVHHHGWGWAWGRRVGVAA